MIFGFRSRCAAVAALKRRGGRKRGDFQGGADTTGEIRFTSVRPRRRQKRQERNGIGWSFCARDFMTDFSRTVRARRRKAATKRRSKRHSRRWSITAQASRPTTSARGRGSPMQKKTMPDGPTRRRSTGNKVQNSDEIPEGLYADF